MTNVMRWPMFQLAVVIATTLAHATPAIDQQQNVIDSTVGGSAIGGDSAISSCGMRERNGSTISRTRRLIDVETHEAVFTWMLRLNWSSPARISRIREQGSSGGYHVRPEAVIHRCTVRRARPV